MAEGAAYLAGIEPRFARALELTGPLPLRRRRRRLRDAVLGDRQPAGVDRLRPPRSGTGWRRSARPTPPALLAASDEALRAAGLSRQKIAYGRAIAGSGLDFAALRVLPDADIVAELTRIKGIGVWTAEIYAMFSLGRPDVFAPGDLALRDAAARLFELEARPSEKALREMSLAWSPWRSVAARLLWAYYRAARGREGVR